MKQVKICLQDLLTVLEAMRDSGGTIDVIFFEYQGLPALRDADDEDNMVTFQTYDDEMENKDGDSIH